MSGEKTENPTPKKLRDARMKGQVAKSQDVVSAAMTISLFIVISMMWPMAVDEIKSMILLPTHFYTMPFEDAMGQLTFAIFMKIAKLSVPVLLVVIFVALASNLAQVGFLLVMEPVKPDLKKLNPMDKIKQIFSMKNLFELLKSSLKILIIGGLVASIVTSSLNPLTRLPHGGNEAILNALHPMMSVLATNVTLAYIGIAGVDYVFQKFQHTKQLKMSKDEIKREYKESEGDPQIKGKRKQLHQEMIMSDTTERTKKATVVVTNPTHLAVAIYYKEEENVLPKVIAKGEDHVARRMVEVAREEGIPVMQHIPLARSLHEHVDIDRYIPSDLIEPMAEVLRWVKEWHEAGGASGMNQ